MDSSPDRFDEWFAETHATGKPSWELSDDDTGLEEELEVDEFGT